MTTKDFGELLKRTPLLLTSQLPPIEDCEDYCDGYSVWVWVRYQRPAIIYGNARANMCMETNTLEIMKNFKKTCLRIYIPRELIIKWEIRRPVYSISAGDPLTDPT